MTIQVLEADRDLLGEDNRRRLNKYYKLLCMSSYALYFIGDSGSGKTFFGQKLCKMYAERHGVKWWYLQLSPDQTKTSIILGNRLIAGNWEAVPGLVGRAARDGDIVFVDEATHSTPQILLLFNSLVERDAKTSIGDLLIHAKPTFRLVFASNPDTHIGNTRIPQSLAQRLMCKRFDYPSFETECKIASQIAQSEHARSFEAGEIDFEYSVPDPVIRYMTSYIREMRTRVYPLSARNVAKLAINCAVEYDDLQSEGKIYDGQLDSYFLTGQNLDAVNATIFTRLFQKPSRGKSDYLHDDVVTFKEYISYLGIEVFREHVLDSIGYDLPIDGVDIGRKQLRERLVASIL